jgi:hypothetical protein
MFLRMTIAVLLAVLSGALPVRSQGHGQGYTSRDRGFYWYGVGAGIAITVCELERNGDVKHGFARNFIRQARSGEDLRKEPKAVEGLMDATRSRNCQGL